MLGRTVVRQFAANEKLLKRRMKSVAGIQKITAAMKMVAASKMRQELTRLENGGEFGYHMAANWFEDDDTAKRYLPVYTPEHKTLMVPITSDRGLCGGINSSIVRDIKEQMKKSKRDRFTIYPVGEKGTAALLRPFADILPSAITALQTPVSYSTAAAIAHHLEEAMKEYGCDRIELVYTRFINKLSTEIRRLEVMDRQGFRNGHYKCLYEVEEPDFPLATEIYYELYVASSIYHVLLNSATAEQSSRMNAMETASKNCGELLGKLSLEYNKLRQAKITLELCEVISGAEAAK